VIFTKNFFLLNRAPELLITFPQNFILKSRLAIQDTKSVSLRALSPNVSLEVPSNFDPCHLLFPPSAQLPILRNLQLVGCGMKQVEVGNRIVDQLWKRDH